ncbi:hypothetical protein D3C84_841410 [compost metagenome]
MSKKVKSVYFNTNDPWEFNLFEYSQQYPNFSKFVKRLIQNHIDGVSPNQIIQQDVQFNPTQNEVETPIIDKDLIKSFL